MSFISLSCLKRLSLLLCLFLPSISWAKPIPESASMDFELIIPTIKTSTYARPYVAVWIENEKRQAVRTIELWVGKDEWLKDLRSWWRKAGRYDREMVDAVTSATRSAGLHRFSWDGLDQQGKRLQQGNYTLYIEVVREHGGRNLIRKKLQLAETDFTYSLAASEETGQIKLTYQVQ